jgi:hypothetical protein
MEVLDVSARLGEMLLKVGALTEDQLEQVLGAQSVYGGRLGTNLVEMGLLEEDELARLLYEKLGVPCIDAAALDSVPLELLEVVPLDMAQRYRVLPVALNGKRLLLAMADPSDFQAIDEIGFVTGLVIVPRVCPELRLNIALERYYGIKRAMRYIPVAGGLRTRFAGKAFSDADADAPAASGAALAGPPESGSGRQRIAMDDLAERMAGARGEGEVVSALLEYLGGEFDRCAFFSLKKGTALGVQAVGSAAEVAGFAGCAIPVAETEQLRRVVQENRFFIGELSSTGADRRLMGAMGGLAAQVPALLMPVTMGGKVAAVICVNDLKGRLAGGVFELQRAVAMAQLAFEMLCLKKRIRSGLG